MCVVCIFNVCLSAYLTLQYLTAACRSAGFRTGEVLGGMGCFGVKIVAIGCAFPVIKTETSC